LNIDKRIQIQEFCDSGHRLCKCPFNFWYKLTLMYETHTGFQLTTKSNYFCVTVCSELVTKFLSEKLYKKGEIIEC
jgi:hypothetical protein